MGTRSVGREILALLWAVHWIREVLIQRQPAVDGHISPFRNLACWVHLSSGSGLQGWTIMMAAQGHIVPIYPT